MKDQLQRKKLDEIKQDADEINERVQDWVEKMKKLKKQQGD